jgi:hypothetical protein
VAARLIVSPPRRPRQRDFRSTPRAQFEHEAPALAKWSFRPEQEAAIDCPCCRGARNRENRSPSAIRAFIHELFPRCEDVDLEDGDHFSVATDPAAVAEPIAAFVSRHSAPAVLT